MIEFLGGVVVGAVFTFLVFLAGMIAGALAEEKHVTGEVPRVRNRKRWYDL